MNNKEEEKSVHKYCFGKGAQNVQCGHHHLKKIEAKKGMAQQNNSQCNDRKPCFPMIELLQFSVQLSPQSVMTLNMSQEVQQRRAPRGVQPLKTIFWMYRVLVL